MSVKEISFQGMDVYETYAIDDKTIGIRPKWISVEDVLVYAINEHGETYEKGERYFAIDRLVQWSDGSGITFRTDMHYGKVTHWMKLPPTPEEEK